MQRITVLLPADTLEQLARFAVAERRDARDQAAIFIERGLEEISRCPGSADRAERRGEK